MTGENHPQPNRRQFPLSSMLLVMTLVSVGLGLFLAAPPLGIVFLLVSIMPLIRTGLWSRRRKLAGSPLSLAEIAWDSFVSMAIQLTAGWAFIVACAMSCGVGEGLGGLLMFLGVPDYILMNYLFGIALVVGLCASIGFTIWIVRLMWSVGRKTIVAIPICPLCQSPLSPEGLCRICLERVGHEGNHETLAAMAPAPDPFSPKT